MNSVGIADLSVCGDMDANKENADSIDDLTRTGRGNHRHGCPCRQIGKELEETEPWCEEQ